MDWTSGIVLPGAVDMIVHRQLDLLNDRLMMALFDATRLVKQPTVFSHIEPVVASRPVAVVNRRFVNGMFFCDPVSFPPFAEGRATMVAVYRGDRTSAENPIISIHANVRARPSAGPVKLSWPDGLFPL